MAGSEILVTEGKHSQRFVEAVCLTEGGREVEGYIVDPEVGGRVFGGVEVPGVERGVGGDAGA